MNISQKIKHGLFVLILLFSKYQASCQTTSNYSLLDNLHPVTPNVFQFVKYSEMPVSEYTGRPNVSIPLFQINEDGLSIPLNLTYHAGGIRVSEESSWVGLGWDLQIGSIVQQINDQDDFAATTRIRPDYANTSQPIEFPMKYNYCGFHDEICNYGCNGPLPIVPVSAAEGFMIYTNEYAPFNGVYGGYPNQNYLHFFDNHIVHNVDSEPDIFTANFPGHSFKFVLDWSTGNLVVLNKKGYKVTRNGDIFTVLVPSGEEYDFALKSVVQSHSISDNIISALGLQASQIQPSSNIWMLTQIITKNTKSIKFNYTQTGVNNCFPSLSQKGIIANLTTQYQSGPNSPQGVCYRGTVTDYIPASANLNTITYSQESYVYLSSIVFPNGQVIFTTSANRNDLIGGYRLDNVSVKANQQVKSFNFNYGYFDANTVGGNSYDPNLRDNSNFGTTSRYRLKLLSLQDNSGATHTFTYNSVQLPAKNSYGIDYWGYYNGQVTNTTMVPNASQFVSSINNINMSFLGNNGDNHSANVNYAQAGVLQQIKYPTGGTVNFLYELNQFDNYWVPDFSTSSNTISSGNGLRIQSVTWLDAAGNQLKKTGYSYAGGKAIAPLSIFRNYQYESVHPGDIAASATVTLYKICNINELNMNGYFSSNPFGSINGVGYSQVTKADFDTNNMSNGKEVSNYYNNPDQAYVNVAPLALNQIDASLPAYKDANSPDNGSVQSVSYYDKNNNIVKNIANTYANTQSPIYYGARSFGFRSVVRWSNGNDIGIYQQNVMPQTMVGYYPIYDFETLLSGSTETDYYGGNSISVSKSYTYNQYNQLVKTTVTNSDQNQESTYFGYSSSATPSPIINDLISRNRLSDVVGFSKSYGSTGAYPYNLERSYKYKGNLIVPDKDIVTVHSSLSIPSYTTYDEYDTDNGNLLQYTVKGVPSSLVYDYNKEYVTAEIKNAKLNQVAYTSFESDGKGNWVFTGLSVPDDSSPTGKRAYNLINGQITASNLDNNKTYTVSYWSKSGPQLVNSVNPIKQGRSYKGWTYYEHAISGLSNGTVLVSGTGVIDELRLYPNDAQMTTYTYLPLIGTSSVSDIANNILYYEYDQSQRLKTVRNQDGHIIKSYCYNYAGQAMGCDVAVTTYQSVAKSGSYIKNDCGSGYTGSSVTYNVLANAYTSTISQEDADQKAQEDVNANGQAYVNAHGSCTVTPTTLYTRVEISNITVNVSGTGVTNNTTSTSGDVYIRLYSDAACTQHYTATANTTVLIAEGNNFSYAFGGGYSYTNNVSFTVASGTSELLVGNSLLSSYNTYEVESYGTFTDYYNYSYDAIVNTGSTYTPSTTVYN